MSELGVPLTPSTTAAREVFESSTDFTVGLEEEFALLDPDTLSLSNVFEEIRAEADADDLLADSVAGELIASEIEIRSGKGEDFADALERQHERRRRLFALAESRGVALGATGTHPWSPWQEQRIIDTPHYRLVEEKLKYVAWRNNTFSNHVHVGIRGADRAVAVCDALRPVLPVLLAASANSPWVGGPSSRPALRAHGDLHPHVPALRDPGPLRQLGGLRGLRRLPLPHALDRSSTPQIWWSVRPHLTLRDGRGPDHGRAVLRGRVHGAARARDGLRRAGGARLRRRPTRPGAARTG